MSAHVYFAKSEPFPDLIKIGMSNYLHERIRSISQQYRGPVRLLCALEVEDSLIARRTEAALHRRFADQRVTGEWFSLSESYVLAEFGSGWVNAPEERRPVTIVLPRFTAKRMKILAAKHGFRVQSLYTQAIETWLSAQSDSPALDDLDQ